MKNHKPAFAVGGTVIGTTVVAGAIAWLYYHNRDITLTYSNGYDDDFVSKLANALKAFRNSLRIIGIPQDNLDKAKGIINEAVKEANMDGKFNQEVEDTGVIVITKAVDDDGNVTLSAEFEKDNKEEENQKSEVSDTNGGDSPKAIV